jgi:hypothetical protein
MATYFFETIIAARALSFCAPSMCFATDGDDEGAGGGGPASPPSEAPKPAPTLRGPKLIKAVVRHGTVVTGPHGEETHTGPGGEVYLPESDVIELRARGVLHDPRSAPSFEGGPTVDYDETETKAVEVRPRAKPAARKR